MSSVNGIFLIRRRISNLLHSIDRTQNSAEEKVNDSICSQFRSKSAAMFRHIDVASMATYRDLAKKFATQIKKVRKSTVGGQTLISWS